MGDTMVDGDERFPKKRRDSATDRRTYAETGSQSRTRSICDYIRVNYTTICCRKRSPDYAVCDGSVMLRGFSRMNPNSHRGPIGGIDVGENFVIIVDKARKAPFGILCQAWTCQLETANYSRFSSLSATLGLSYIDRFFFFSNFCTSAKPMRSIF